METNKQQDNYLDSSSYENFLNRAFKFNKSLRRPSRQEYINLIQAEQGNKHSWLPKFEKQLNEVRSRLEKAVDIFASKSKDQEEIRNLEILRSKILQIRSFNDIPEIVQNGLEITQNIKE